MRFALVGLSLPLAFAPVPSAPASAHALLERAVPAPGATVAAPAEIALTFTAPVDPGRSAVAVRCGDKPVPGAPRRPGDDPRQLALALPGARPGPCDVAWHVTTGDAERTDGHYGFTIGATPASPPAAPAPKPASAPAETGAAARPDASAIAVTGAWARATPPRATEGVAYLTLRSARDDRLVGVSTPAARAATVHDMGMDGEVMRMRPLPDGLALPAGREVALAPGGLHLMLEGLKAPLKQGDPLRLRLEFQHAAPMDVEVPVRAIGQRAP